ncbi:MAG: hypothetical protein ACLGI6_22040 [Gammaproteobacteria bacterium]
MSLWATLGIEATSDERAIKRAYAKKLKATRPEDDPAGFQALRAAYDSALRIAALAREEVEDAAADENEIEADAAPVVVNASGLRHPPMPPQPGDVPTPTPPAAIGILKSVPPPPVLRMPPAQVATRLWEAFLKHGTQQPRQHLRQIADGEPMLNLEVADQFELCAVRYCAGEACTEALRIDIAEHFGWKDDMAFAMRELPNESADVLARLRARESYAHFLKQEATSLEVNALLNGAPRGKLDKTSQRSFTLAMRRLLATIRDHHPEMLRYRLDADRFAAWEGRVNTRRYFRQTAYKSFFAGLFLVWPLTMALLIFLLGPGGENEPLSFLLAQGISFGLGALIAFKGAPGFVLRWRARAAERLEPLMYDWRYRRGVQLFSLRLFIAAGMLTLIPNPSNGMLMLVDVALFVCLAVCSFANSVRLSRTSFLLWGATALVSVGVVLSDGHGLANIGFLSHAILFFLVFQLCNRGGDYLDLFNVDAKSAADLRIYWLLGSIVISLFAHYAPLPTTVLALLLWLWLVAGAVFAGLSMGIIGFFLVPFLAGLAVQLTPARAALDVPTIRPLAMLIMGIAMCSLSRISGQPHS